MNILLVLEVGHVDTLFLQLLHFRVFFRGVDLVVARDGAFFGGGGSSRHLPVYRLFAGEKGDEGVDLACSRTLSAVRVSVDLFYKIKDTKKPELQCILYPQTLQIVYVNQFSIL